MKSIAVISNDLRQEAINNYLIDHGYKSQIYNTMDFSEADIIIAPTPFSKENIYLNCDFYSSFPLKTFAGLIKPTQFVYGGNIPVDFINIFPNCHDFLKDDYVVWNNGSITAEGLIGKIINNIPTTIDHSNVLIIGFGKCGMNICLKLKALGANVTILDHTYWHLCKACSMGFNTVLLEELNMYINQYDILINTVPESVLSDNDYTLVKASASFFEIASFPYGFNKNKIDANHYYNYPGLPGKTAPVTAGELIAKCITTHIERNEATNA